MTLARRIAHLERPLPGGHLPAPARVLAAKVAAEMGLDANDVVRETEAILVRAEAAGVLGSGAALATFLAAESGIAPEVLLAEAQRLVERS
jgi:hypothetical protein